MHDSDLANFVLCEIYGSQKNVYELKHPSEQWGFLSLRLSQESLLQATYGIHCWTGM